MRLNFQLRVAAAAALILTACGGESTFDIDIISNDRCNGLSIIEPNDRVILTVSGPGMSPVVVEARGASGGIEAPDIPAGPDRVAKVQVCSASGGSSCDLRAAGESAPFEVREDGAAPVRVVLYRTNFFSKVVAAGSGDCSSMGTPRAGHVGVLLSNGKVLLAGGFTGLDGDRRPTGFLRSVEIFDPARGTFQAAADLPAPRAHARAVRLKNGQVLVVGGVHEEGGEVVPAKDAFLFDGTSWTTVETAAARRGHTVTLVERSGHAVVVGGVDADEQVVSIVEYFDPETGSFHQVEDTDPGAFARAWHVAANVGAGSSPNTIAVAGGVDSEGNVSGDVSLLVWDGATRKYRAQANRFQIEPVMRAAALKLGTAGDPRLVIAGGASNFTAPAGRPGAGTPSDPTDGVQWFEPTSGQSRGSTALTSGRVYDACGIGVDASRGLVIGGTTGGRGPSATGELLQLQQGTITASKAGESTGSMQPVHHAACVDMGARGVLVTGGLDLREDPSGVAYTYLTKPSTGG